MTRLQASRSASNAGKAKFRTRNIHPYTSERGGYPGWGLVVIGSDMVDLGFAYSSSVVTLNFIFKDDLHVYVYIYVYIHKYKIYKIYKI